MPYPGLLHPEPLSSQQSTAARTSSGDTQTQFCLRLCGVSGFWCTQGTFEPSEHLWWVWGLILNVILPLLPSFWGFSFALGCRISPHSCSSTTQLPLQDLLELTPQKEVFFIIGVWNAKVGSQEIPGAMGKFGLGVQGKG